MIVPKDCADIQQFSGNKSGIYSVFPATSVRPTRVYCDLATDMGGWLVRFVPGGVPSIKEVMGTCRKFG